MRLGAAEALHVDLLAGDAADHLGAGDEDPAGAAHDHDVGQRRAVRGAAGRRAEHDGDLRHPTGGPHHGREDLAHRVERDHTLGEAGAAGVPQADHRHPLPYREVDRLDDVLAALGAHRAAHPGGVGGERDHRRAVDLTAGAQHAGVVAARDRAQRAPVEQGPQAHLGVAIVDRGLVGRVGGDGHGVPPVVGRAAVVCSRSLGG